LKRAIGLPALLFYGLGTTVGGGIYALLGKVAGEAGYGTPLAFLAAGVLALPSACAYAELGARLPFSAAESRYVLAGFGSRNLAAAIGYLVISTGVVSSAALSVATVGFLGDLIELDRTWALIGVVLAFGAVAAWGIGESVAIIVVITLIEVAALIYVVAVGALSVEVAAVDWPAFLPGADASIWIGIFSGGFLAFYAFIGFEDMANVAEEVKNVRRNLPIAVIACVVISTLLYMAVATVGVLVVTPDELALAATPLAAIVRDQGAGASLSLSLVSMLTGVNGALVQIVVGSRIVYGLAGRGLLPRRLGAVNPVTRTPLLATLLITSVVLVLALVFPLATLARGTSAIILVVFGFVNASLWRLKRREPADTDLFPIWMPIIGTFACALVLLSQIVLGAA
jgi:amino acid transporter